MTSPQHQVGRNVFHIFPGRLRAVTVLHPVVVAKQRTQVACQLHIVVHHQQLGLRLQSRALSFQRRRLRQRLRKRFLYLGLHMLVFAVSLLAHRQDKTERHPAFGHILHLDVAMMQLHQALHVVQAYACSPAVAVVAIHFFRLVVTLEYIGQLFLRDVWPVVYTRRCASSHPPPLRTPAG